MSSFPYKVGFFRAGGLRKIWWTVSSDPEDNMLAGDGIPGDKETAEYTARCCDMAYHTAVIETLELINENSCVNVNVEWVVNKLMKK